MSTRVGSVRRRRSVDSELIRDRVVGGFLIVLYTGLLLFVLTGGFPL